MISERLSLAVQLIKAGNKRDALPILKEVLQSDPNNENAWLWLSACVEPVEQKKYCLERAIRINPENQQARSALLRLEDHISTSAQPPHTRVSPSQTSRAELRSAEHIGIQRKAPKAKAGKGILPLLAIGLSVCVLFSLFAIVIARTPLISQAFSLFAGGSYSSSMKPLLDELQAWLNGPVQQYERALSSPYGHGESNDYTNLDAMNLYDMTAEFGALGYSPSDIVNMRQDIRANLAENLLPTLSAIRQDGFAIVTRLEGIDPPNSVRTAHEKVTSCVNYKIEFANAMIIFLETGDDSITPTGDCNFFEESLQTIAEFMN